MNKIIQYLTPLFIFLFLLEPAQAKESGFGKARHAVGFSIGSTMGPGLTYRFYSSRSFYQGAFFARVTSRDDISDLMMSASYGRVLSNLSVVKALPPTALVFVTGIEGLYSKDQFSNRANNGDTGNEKSVHTGLGIALEIGNTFTPGLLFSLGTSYMLSVDRLNSSWEWNLGPQVNVGLLYNW